MFKFKCLIFIITKSFHFTIKNIYIHKFITEIHPHRKVALISNGFPYFLKKGKMNILQLFCHCDSVLSPCNCCLTDFIKTGKYIMTLVVTMSLQILSNSYEYCGCANF